MSSKFEDAAPQPMLEDADMNQERNQPKKNELMMTNIISDMYYGQNQSGNID